MTTVSRKNKKDWTP
ncbi:MAG: hypothetical protein ACEY3D_02475 [Rickettsia sp.]